MKKPAYACSLLTLFLFLALLSPASVLASGDGNKHFRAGMRFEDTEQWDQAVEEFALAVTDNPKNPDYRLHLQRALFNASQMYMKKGTAAAEQKDYQGAYLSFRKAYGYDPVNELAKSEMARMVRLQEESTKADKPDTKSTDSPVKLVQTSYNTQPGAPDTRAPQRLEKLRDVPFPGGVDLQYIVKELAKELDLNVLFDAASRLDGRKIHIELRSVTAAKALDYIFLQENLFFQRVGPRTVLVADGNRRPYFQQLVLRTFYLANASPKDVKAVISQAIPPQPGRSQTIVLEDASTNSITVRDTEENVRLIGKLISSLDKDRAEVVMDVAIYEVNKNDLLQFGNQLGTAGAQGTLLNLGGIGPPSVRAGGSDSSIVNGLPFKPLDFASIALGVPISSIVALQRKDNTKLLASTQIHAFNNEDSSARIGQRIPVRSATYQTGTVTGNGVVSDVINYEQVGLTLKFKPIVFPNQDVQVAMEIESKDVAGIQTLTPTFTERTIKGTARIQNNKTLLLASVATGVESNGREGLPLLGLLPIIGRLFTAPTKENRQVDIVIAVTPRVIRAPAILPDDEAERFTGAVGTPTNSSLEAMIIQEDRDELLAAARRAPNTANIQLPDQPAEAPTYVRTGASQSATEVKAPENQNATAAVQTPATDVPNLRPIDSSARTLDITKTADTSKAKPEPEPAVDTAAPAENKPVAQLSFGGALPEMKVGQKFKIPVMVDSSSLFRSAVIGLKFDEKRLAVRSVSFGDLFGTGLANTGVSPFLNQGGKMYVSLSLPQGTVTSSSGVLAYVEVEALADGKPDISVERDVVNFLAADGKNFAVKF